MAEPTTLGTWLRRERERRGVTLTQISEQTKVSLSFLQGLEADDLSRWPGGIFRRSFARAYASAIGLEPELVVRRLLEEHPDPEMVKPEIPAETASQGATAAEANSVSPPAAGRWRGMPPRARVRAVLLDMLMACATALGFAAAGTSPLWAVLVLAVYHAAGLFLTGTTPMAALLAAQEPPVAATPGPAPSRATPRDAGRRAETPARRPHRAARRAGGWPEPARPADRRV